MQARCVVINCDTRWRIFYDPLTQTDLTDFLCFTPENKAAVVVAHGGERYDHNFVLDELLRLNNRPQLVYVGHKIVSMITTNNVRFKDSYTLIPTRLAHFLATEPEMKNGKDRNELMLWWEQNRHTSFDCERESRTYCKQDVSS